ncbi:putative polysaccharide biosynthesis protein [Caldinitratiruptor microaerophilus]|uniref:Sporulation protein SpoVB n=1 Tax=Caldinitratiruptor microaerophilus TaxID=671077 RepID=A0AA35G586_9FIRM|nr:polysaccharide biosynthesis protein [Caldinitratiruptor microaerophilus]BDG58921.1 sporulation protein SpoVB [Caldinitratiruptor microaerophilus]
MKQRESAVRGAAVLAASGLLIRLSGLVYQVPLANWLGAEGIGLYRMALPAFWAFYRLALGGVPTAVSTLVAEYDGRGRSHVSEQVFQLGMVWIAVSSAVASAALALGAGLVARLVGDPRTELVLVALSPAIYFFSIQQGYGAYLQGRQRITPWGVAGLIEQGGRIAGALVGVIALRPRGLAWGAAGAALGNLAGGVLSLLYLALTYRRVRRRPRARWDPGEPLHKLVGQMARLAWPLMLSAAVLPLLNLLDVAVIQRGLQRGGLSPAEATALYGQYSGMAYVLATMPSVFALAFGHALLPVVAAARARGDWERVRSRCLVALRAMALLGLPSALGMAVLAVPLMTATFGMPEAARLLVWSAPIALLNPLMVVAAAALQGLGLTGPPVRNLTAALVLKVVLDAAVSGIPGSGIYAVVAGSALSYALTAWLNVRTLERHLDWSVPWSRVLLRPLLASLVMAAGVGILLAGGWVPRGPWGQIGMALVVAPPLYALGLAFTGALGREDLYEIAGPALRRLERFEWLERILH